MRIKLVKQWGHHLPGAFLDTQGNMARMLIRRGMAVDAKLVEPYDKADEAPKAEAPRGRRGKRSEEQSEDLWAS